MTDKPHRIYQIGRHMEAEGYLLDFISKVTQAAEYFDGVYDLLVMWAEEDNEMEKAKTIAAIDDLMKDIYG